MKIYLRFLSFLPNLQASLSFVDILWRMALLCRPSFSMLARGTSSGSVLEAQSQVSVQHRALNRITDRAKLIKQKSINYNIINSNEYT